MPTVQTAPRAEKAAGPVLDPAVQVDPDAPAYQAGPQTPGTPPVGPVPQPPVAGVLPGGTSRSPLTEVTVTFLRRYEMWNANVPAGFPADRAADLVRRGIAVYGVVDITTMPNTRGISSSGVIRK